MARRQPSAHQQQQLAPRTPTHSLHPPCSYATGAPVLRNISFDLPGGRTLALVGATGSGKSTLVRLLVRCGSGPTGLRAGRQAGGRVGGRPLLQERRGLFCKGRRHLWASIPAAGGQLPPFGPGCLVSCTNITPPPPPPRPPRPPPPPPTPPTHPPTHPPHPTCRFYDPTAGRVLIDGADVTAVTLHSLRSAIAVVPQDCVSVDGWVGGWVGGWVA